MRVAIIGAGAAGLASARHVNSRGFSCDVFELREQLGGTWVYTDEVGKDRYGYPVYSAMYRGLRTNLPKEVMGFPDFPISGHEKSYLTQAEVLDFLNLYADNFKLKPLIKFNTMVTDVRPVDSDYWQLTYTEKPSGTEHKKIYDAVMICNGHYNEPVIPELPGQEKFTGKIEHSHNFRSPEPYEGKRVLVIGAGPSGLDITLQVSSVAKQVALSCHREEISNTKYPENVIKKPDVKRIIDEEGIEFVDGTCSGFDVIILCTGYNYSFPFLHESCDITIDQNFIQPLYKHMIHIERPTMCFIGIPFNVCAFQMFDLQARFCCKVLTSAISLPSKEKMRCSIEQDIQRVRASGLALRKVFKLGVMQKEYYNDIADEADITTILPVVNKICTWPGRMSDLETYKKDIYILIDDDNFKVIRYKDRDK